MSYAGKYVEVYTPGCWLDTGPYGCLGNGLGYAIAARVAHPDRQVVVMLGDGAAGFSLMDVDTLVRHDLPVVMVVGNNGIWGLEKHPMQALYGYDVAADLQPGCRYDEVVAALGGAGETVSVTADVGPALDRAFAAGVPYLVNVMTDPDDVYPRRRTSADAGRVAGRVRRSVGGFVEEALDVDHHAGDLARGDQAPASDDRHREDEAPALDLVERGLGADLAADAGGREVVELDPHADRRLALARDGRRAPHRRPPRRAPRPGAWRAPARRPKPSPWPCRRR